jgi:hypothetical protein
MLKENMFNKIYNTKYMLACIFLIVILLNISFVSAIVITNPNNFTLADNESAYYDFNATTSGTIDTWVLNDTTYFAVDGATGEFTNSSVVPIGLYWLDITVNDSNGYYNNSIFYIEVTNSTHNPPVITNIQNFNMYSNASASYQFLATNVSVLTWALTGSASFQIDSATGEMTNSSVVIVGNYFMNVSVVDEYGTGDSGTFYIYVISPPATPSPTTATAVFYMVLLGILIFFLACCIFGFLHFDNLLARVGLFGAGYLLFIAITFVGWECASTFLGTSFIVSAMEIMFYVAIIGAFPLLIGAFAWYLIMLFKVKEIERLMSKGMDMDEAEERVRRRKR